MAPILRDTDACGRELSSLEIPADGRVQGSSRGLTHGGQTPYTCVTDRANSVAEA